VNDRKITALAKFNGRRKILFYLNVIPKEGSEELKEKFSTVIEFPFKEENYQTQLNFQQKHFFLFSQ